MVINCATVRELAPGFVLGALDRSEMAAVREHLATCRRPHPELRELGGVVPYIGDTLVPIEPSAALRQNVIAAARADLEVRSAPAASRNGTPRLTVVEPARTIVPFATMRSRLPSRRAAVWVTRVAAAALILVLTGTVITLRGELGKAPAPWGDLTNKSRLVALEPVGNNSGAGFAALMESGNLRINVYNLAATTGDQVYMVWVSADGGSPRAGGWFTADSGGSGTLTMKNLNPSSSLWVYVCREPNRNVTSPSRDIVVSGTIYLWATPGANPASI